MLCAYRSAWECIPELREWLRPDPSSTSRAHCSLCQCQLNANLTLLRRHAAAVHSSGAPRPPRAPRPRKYDPAWRHRPELSAWLRRSPLNPAAAFCLPCNKELQPALTYLQRHATCALHVRRSRRPGAARPGAAAAAVARPRPAGIGDSIGDVEAWRRVKAFAPWLRRSAADPRKAFCLFCYKEMTAKITHVRRHAACARHARCARAASFAAPDAAPAEEASPAGPGRAASPAPDLDAVPAWESDPEWTPDGQTESKPGAEAALHEFTPVLLPRADVTFSPPPSPEPERGSGSPAAAPAPRYARYTAYNADWERRPELAGWLARSPEQPRRAFCTVCRCEITPKLAHVRRHGASARHRRTAEAAGLEVVCLEGAEKSARIARRPAGRAKRQSVVVQNNDDDCVDDSGDPAQAEDASDAASEDWPLAEDGDGPDLGEEERLPEEAVSGGHEALSASLAPGAGPAVGVCRRLSYQPSWEQLPELHGWLGRSPWDAQRPFCRYCRREVTAKLAHLRRHATSGLHRRNLRQPTAEAGPRPERPTPLEGVTEAAASANIMAEKTTLDSSQPAELGPFGSCLVCKHPLVVRLNIFRTRTQTSRRLVASLLSRLVQRPFSEESYEPSASEICTSCAALLDTADELQTKLAAVENEVRLKFRMPCPLPARKTGASWPRAAGRAEVSDLPDLEQPDDTDSQLETPPPSDKTKSQDDDTVLDGLPMAYITIGDPDQEGSAIMVRTERLEDGNVVVFREPVQIGQPEQSADVFCDALTGSDCIQEEVLHEEASVPEQPWTGPSRRRASQRGGRRRPASGRSRDTDRPDEQRHYDCVFCHCSFRTSLALHRHWNTDHPLKLRPCPYCPKRYLHGSSLKQHIRTHEQRGYACEQCGRQFAANCDLKKHRLFRHSAVRRFPCADCTRAFKLKWMLARHRRMVHREG